MPPTKSRCCRTTPRCRSCPLRFATELREVRALGQPGAHVPEHLAGIPACLHKYEPLFRRTEEEQPVQPQQLPVAPA